MRRSVEVPREIEKNENRGRENKEYILQVRPTDEEERTWDKI